LSPHKPESASERIRLSFSTLFLLSGADSVADTTVRDLLAQNPQAARPRALFRPPPLRRTCELSTPWHPTCETERARLRCLAESDLCVLLVLAPSSPASIHPALQHCYGRSSPRRRFAAGQRRFGGGAAQQLVRGTATSSTPRWRGYEARATIDEKLCWWNETGQLEKQWHATTTPRSTAKARSVGRDARDLATHVAINKFRYIHGRWEGWTGTGKVVLSTEWDVDRGRAGGTAWKTLAALRSQRLRGHRRTQSALRSCGGRAGGRVPAGTPASAAAASAHVGAVTLAPDLAALYDRLKQIKSPGFRGGRQHSFRYRARPGGDSGCGVQRV
jgi:hypothetical protein